ncbi:DUF721 domain-containing protein [Demetria terragena]|uniref:DUF721 domain-containing protein n=1 Tax=Demetria terragena TaxID=63959 RepID=UPI000372D6EB|nr:DciA family protein [Demetria terragena]
MSDVPEPAKPDPEFEDAAAAALFRMRRAARDRGLRPGAPVARRRRAGELGRSSRGSDKQGRDPITLGDQLDRLLRDRDWKVDVAAGSVMGQWADIVGADVAGHATPVSFEGGVLTVRAESTAWATELRWLASTLLARMDEAVGSGVVTDLKVVGPSAPSWKRGPRSVSDGRGPRDTYG